MPNFTIPNQRVSPASLPGVRVSADTMGYGRAAQAVNQGIQNVAGGYLGELDRERVRLQGTRLQEQLIHDDTLMTEKFYAGPDALFSRSSGNAMGIGTEANAFFDEAYENGIKNFNTDEERDAYTQRFNATRNRMMSSVHQREQGQHRVYEDQTYKAGEANLRRHAYASTSDPQGMLESDKKTQELYTQRALSEGWSDEARDLKIADGMAQNRRTRFLTLAEENPEAAVEFFVEEEANMTLTEEGRAGLINQAKKSMAEGTSARMRKVWKSAEEVKPGSGTQAVRAESERIMGNTGRMRKTTFRSKQGLNYNLSSTIAKSRLKHVTPDLLHAVVEVESDFDSDAAAKTSSARGFGQILKGTAKTIAADVNIIGPNFNGPSINVDNPDQNLNGSARYLERMFQHTKTDKWDIAVAAYHDGPGAVDGYIAKAGFKYNSDVGRYVSDDGRVVTYADIEPFMSPAGANHIKKVAKAMGGAQEMPEWAKTTMENTAAAEVSRGVQLDKTTKMQPSDPGVQSAVLTAIGYEMGNPVEFAGKTTAELEDLYRTKMPESTFQQILKAQQDIKSQPDLQEAMTLSTSFLRSQGIFKGGTSDKDEDVEARNRWYWLKGEVWRGLVQKSAEKNGVKLTDAEMKAVTTAAVTTQQEYEKRAWVGDPSKKDYPTYLRNAPLAKEGEKPPPGSPEAEGYKRKAATAGSQPVTSDEIKKANAALTNLKGDGNYNENDVMNLVAFMRNKSNAAN